MAHGTANERTYAARERENTARPWPSKTRLNVGFGPYFVDARSAVQSLTSRSITLEGGMVMSGVERVAKLCIKTHNGLRETERKGCLD